MRVGIDCRKIDDFGIGTYIRGLLTAMAGVEYVAFGPHDLDLPAGIEHVMVDAPKYSIRELFRVGRGVKIDLFHAPHYVVPFVDVPFVVTIHDLIHLRHRNPLARIYARRMIGRAVRKSRRVITVSETVRGQIASEFGHVEKIAVTPNGADHLRSFASLRMREHPYFVFVGNDKPHKNVDRLVEASSRIQGAQLILVGGGFERFRDRAIIAGFVSREELASLYGGAIALVQPSIEEGFGLPALEAMTCGTAVITSNAPALIEITGDAALHVDARSIDDIANAMTRVMHDGSMRAAMIARGLDRAKNFTWRRCADLTREIYIASLDNAFH